MKILLVVLAAAILMGFLAAHSFRSAFSGATYVPQPQQDSPAAAGGGAPRKNPGGATSSNPSGFVGPSGPPSIHGPSAPPPGS